MKKTFFALNILSICLFSCGKEKIENNLIGEWEFEYRTLEDGTIQYEAPYALVEFNYSHGFILYEDHSGFTTWFDTINSDKFLWSTTEEALSIKVTNSSGNQTQYEFTITDIEEHSMNFETYEGRKYFLKKK